MSNVVMQLSDVQVRFPGLYKTVHAVRGVNLSLQAGEIVALVGESGSGKTMTAMAALGLLPQTADISGRCRWLDSETDCETLRQQPPQAGAIIFQNPLTALNPYFTVGQQLHDVAIARTTLRKQALASALVTALQDVNLPDPHSTLQKYPHQLSGGQIQRVVIAMALLCEPKVLIADEPTTALDVTVQAQILLLLKELAAQKGMAVLLITHDLGVVGTLCDRVEVMYAGGIVESGPVIDLLTSPQHPYTRQLLATVPDIERPDDELAFIAGQVPDLSQPINGCAFHDRCDRAQKVCLTPVPTVTVGAQKIVCHQPWLDEPSSKQEGA